MAACSFILSATSATRFLAAFSRSNCETEPTCAGAERKTREAIAERGELADLKLTPHVDLPLDWMTQKRVVGLE